ncbi:Helix-turn-helix [Arthrobacter alpinus]|uniref:Helix-turn-helix n=1 Tax=Arthrobacter alpinus TaxID=656366 RepID=A0A1H5GTL6_9MICC|nr:helix-turn-helix transcriptional regulator [Arthrobacter alpinus]SEE18864.1 Helix-turn-helix [Arthrobacter alpinus]
MNEDFSMLEARAAALVASHEQLMRDLIEMRHLHDLTQEVIADRMGVSQPTVAAFERYDSNPTLSTIRRYALAVHARIENKVEDACLNPDHQFDEIVKRSYATSSSVPVFMPRRTEARFEYWSSPKVMIRANG